MVSVDETTQELIIQLVAAWNSRDMRAFASLFTADASYITGQGRLLKGREAIEQEFSQSQAEDDSDPAVIITGTQTRLLTPDVALAHIEWEMAAPTDQAAAADTPARRGIITQVLIRQGEIWRIAALQNTDIEALQ